MHVEGGCHCGEITYEAEVNPEKLATRIQYDYFAAYMGANTK